MDFFRQKTADCGVFQKLTIFSKLLRLKIVQFRSSFTSSLLALLKTQKKFVNWLCDKNSLQFSRKPTKILSEKWRIQLLAFISDPRGSATRLSNPVTRMGARGLIITPGRQTKYPIIWSWLQQNWPNFDMVEKKC